MVCGHKVLLNYSEDIDYFFLLFHPLNFHIFLQDHICLFILLSFFMLFIFFKCLMSHCFPFRVKNEVAENFTEGSEDLEVLIYLQTDEWFFTKLGFSKCPNKKCITLETSIHPYSPSCL